MRSRPCTYDFHLHRPRMPLDREKMPDSRPFGSNSKSHGNSADHPKSAAREKVSTSGDWHRSRENKKAKDRGPTRRSFLRRREGWRRGQSRPAPRLQEGSPATRRHAVACRSVQTFANPPIDLLTETAPARKIKYNFDFPPVGNRARPP